MQDLARRWRRQSIMCDGLFSIAAASATAAVAMPLMGHYWLVAVAVGIGTFAVRSTINRPWQFDNSRLSQHLNRTYPALEESSQLWLQSSETLTLLQRLQRRRLDAAFGRLAAEKNHSRFGEPPPTLLRSAALFAALAIVGLLGMSVWLALTRRPSHGLIRSLSVSLAQLPAANAAHGLPLLPGIISAELTIEPPVYTRKPTRRVVGLNAEVEEGAFIKWRVKLDAPVHDAQIVLGSGKVDFLPLDSAVQSVLEARLAVVDSQLYHLSATLPDGTAWNSPEVYSLKVLNDLPPVITLIHPQNVRTEISPVQDDGANPPYDLLLEASATDDYGIGSARIVATVAKGSGEAVKFRERSITFEDDKPTEVLSVDLRSRHFVKHLDLCALGMEPGDELYFYLEVADNRQPTANLTRSETRFVVLKGPETKAASPGRGVAGVNLVPQYFRSERQIIIDTEKLIADRPKLASEEFQRRSNDLGIDQQLLRLRYGQFLGEELEEGQGAGDHNDINLDPLQHGVPADMIHQHDTAPESGTGGNDPRAAARTALRLQLEHTASSSSQDEKRGGSEGFPLSTGLPLTPEQVAAQFVDQHDSQDKSTFFDHDAKGTMRDALAAMWEAEGFLRTTRPQEALIPANRALTILKNIQQTARAYVQHVGFEAPPLKEDARRLKGDMADVPERLVIKNATPANDPTVVAVQRALLDMPRFRQTSDLTPEQLNALRGVEPILTAAATNHPDSYLRALQILRLSIAGQENAMSADDAAALQRSLLRLLPVARKRPIASRDESPELTALYFRTLAKKEPEP